LCFRNESYLARCQLAVLDHNEHTERQTAVNKSGDVIYHRKYRKQTKKWDASPVRCDKAYKYVPELIQYIFEERKMSDHGLKHKRIRPQEHPVNIQGTIAHTIPEITSEIVSNVQGYNNYFFTNHMNQLHAIVNSLYIPNNFHLEQDTYHEWPKSHTKGPFGGSYCINAHTSI